jgi:hypothetical protein
MYKNCVQHGQNYSKNLGTKQRFYPDDFNSSSALGISAIYTQLYKQLPRPLMNIKFSLNQPVNIYLSTVSTCPTIMATILKFNELLIIKEVGRT